MNIPVFEQIEVIRGTKRVVWEWIGEGLNGDFDPDDSEDTPMLRFSCYKDTQQDKQEPPEWEQMDDASYCTHMPVVSLFHHLVRAAAIILETIEKKVVQEKAPRAVLVLPR